MAEAGSGISFKEGLILCLPCICRRTGLVLSLLLRPSTMAIQEAVWKLLNREGGRAIVVEASALPQALGGAGGGQVNLILEPLNYSQPLFWCHCAGLSYPFYPRGQPRRATRFPTFLNYSFNKHFLWAWYARQLSENQILQEAKGPTYH